MTLFAESAEYVLQPMPLKFGLAQQLMPVVRRVAALEHFAKDAVGIVAAFVGSLGVIIIDPGVDDHLGRSVVPKKQPVLLKKLGAKPVFPIIAQGAPLSVFRAGGVLRDDIKGKAGNGGQSLGGVLLDVARRVLFLERLDLLQQGFDLRHEQRVRKHRPAVDGQWSRLGDPHSSSADKGASRSTFTSPTSA